MKTSRDAFLVDTDLDRLKARVADYFDPDLSHEKIASRHPRIMRDAARYDARRVRDTLLVRGGPTESGFLRFAYRPFDTRWLYWEADTKLLDEKRAEYQPHVFAGNLWLSAAQHLRKGVQEPHAVFSPHLASLHLIERGASMFPAYLRDGLGGFGGASGKQPNLSSAAKDYLAAVGATAQDLLYHVLATQYDPHYRNANADALRLGWPRIPIPGWPAGTLPGGGEAFLATANRGSQLARLLDTDSAVPGVATGTLRPAIRSIAVPRTTDGGNMAATDFAVTAGWGHFGVGQAVMPGSGRSVERPFTPGERTALGDALPLLGESTFDIYLNDRAYWRNVPAAVWTYKLGGYQVLKKWLSYREQKVLGRAIQLEEVQHFMHCARRIAKILRLGR